MKEKERLEIRELCRQLRLEAVAEHFEEFAKDSADSCEYLLRLLRSQMEQKDQKAIEQRIHGANFPYRKYLEDLELACLPEGIRQRLPELMTLDFIREGRNVILIGNPGTGKTHTAIGLGIRACEAGTRCCSQRFPIW